MRPYSSTLISLILLFCSLVCSDNSSDVDTGTAKNSSVLVDDEENGIEYNLTEFRTTEEIQGTAETTTDAAVTINETDGTKFNGSWGKPHVLHYCNCDLSVDSCDINCCCDPDCELTEKEAFLYCTDRTTLDYLDYSNCFQESLLFVNNTLKTTFNWSKSILCIDKDNLKKSAFYPDVKGAKTEEELKELAKNAQIPSWKNSQPVREFRRGPSSVGEPIWFLSKEGQFVEFEIPFSFTYGKCEGSQKIGYLINTNVTCHIKHFSDENEESDLLTASLLSTTANLFIGKIIGKDVKQEINGTDPMPSAGNDSMVGNANLNRKNISINITEENELQYVEVTGIRYQVARPTVKIGTDCATWQESPGNVSLSDCLQGATRKYISHAELVIYHNGSQGVISLDLFIEFRNISYSKEPLMQEVAITFKSVNDGEVVAKRNGRSGYGHCTTLLMGSAIRNETNEEVSHIQETKAGYIFSADHSSSCTRKVPITFRENTLSSCKEERNLSSETCQEIRKMIMSTLIGHFVNSEAELVVAAYADADVYNPDDWLPVVVDEELKSILNRDGKESSIDGCWRVINSVEIEILFAAQGLTANAQDKLVGFHIKPGKTRKDLVSGSGNIMSSRFNTIQLELTTSVIFIDITPPFEMRFPGPPRLDWKLPYDFFYPFLPSATNGMHVNSGTLLVCLIPMYLRY